MSVVFKVKNKKFITFQKVLSIQNLCSYVQNLEIFGVKEDFDYRTALDKYGIAILGIENESAKGMEVWYEEHYYNIRLNTPATRKDWQIAIEFIKKLYLDLNTKLLCEDKEYSLEDLENFPYIHDIRYGIELIIKNVEEDNLTLYTHGVNQTVAIGKEMVKKIKSGNMIDEYEKLMTSTQYYDAHSANQKFYEKDGAIKGIYVLSENIPTIIPYEPYITYEYSNVIQSSKDVDWKLVVYFVEREEIVELEYNKFINNLDKSQYHFIDENHILVQAQSETQLQEIASKSYC